MELKQELESIGIEAKNEFWVTCFKRLSGIAMEKEEKANWLNKTFGVSYKNCLIAINWSEKKLKDNGYKINGLTGNKRIQKKLSAFEDEANKVLLYKK